MLILVAAVAKNNAIGKSNDLPWYLPEDLKHFKEITKGKTVLMGRKTFESIMARLGKPLPNRLNIVITRQPDYEVPEGVEVYQNIEKAVAAHVGEDIYVIGGGEIYRQTVGMASRMYLTLIDKEVEGADAFFPEISGDQWREAEREDHEEYSFVTYEKV